MNKPRVSVVSSVYNGERYLIECIDSVLAQTYQNFEFVILDNGSFDGTAEILAKYKDNPKIKLLKIEKNQGACLGFETCYNNSNGDFIASIDADDVWHPAKLEEQMKFLELHPEVYFCGTNSERIDGDGKFVYDHAEFDFFYKKQDYDKAKMVDGALLIDRDFVLRKVASFVQPFVHASWIFNKKVFDDLNIAEIVRLNYWTADILVLILLASVSDFAYIPTNLTYRRVNAISVTHGGLELQRVREINSAFFSNFEVMHVFRIYSNIVNTNEKLFKVFPEIKLLFTDFDSRLTRFYLVHALVAIAEPIAFHEPRVGRAKASVLESAFDNTEFVFAVWEKHGCDFIELKELVYAIYTGVAFKQRERLLQK